MYLRGKAINPGEVLWGENSSLCLHVIHFMFYTYVTTIYAPLLAVFSKEWQVLLNLFGKFYRLQGSYC